MGQRQERQSTFGLMTQKSMPSGRPSTQQDTMHHLQQNAVSIRPEDGVASEQRLRVS
jgi:hypothetical protein